MRIFKVPMFLNSAIIQTTIIARTMQYSDVVKQHHALLCLILFSCSLVNNLHIPFLFLTFELLYVPLLCCQRGFTNIPIKSNRVD